MQKSPFTTMLLGASAILVLCAVGLCYMYTQRNTQLRVAQAQLQQFNIRQQAVNALVADVVNYSKTHRDVIPILESAGVTNRPTADATGK